MRHLLFVLLLVAVVGCGPAEITTVTNPGMHFVSIPSGTFTMGENDKAHQVTLTKPFEFGVYEVTQAQYEQVMGQNPSHFSRTGEGMDAVTGITDADLERFPVEQVSWDDAVEFCRKLSELPAVKSAGYVYRLPTEAEWEYACRAGTKAYSFGDNESKFDEYAWYDKNSGSTTHPVGQKKPNGFGLYDMHGNVWEWCQDWNGDYPSGSTTDPTGATSGSDRVFRGGCWYFSAVICRSAFRNRLYPSYHSRGLGFRVVRSSVK